MNYPALAHPLPAPKLVCVVCSKTTDETAYLIRMRPTVSICHRCLAQANQLVREYFADRMVVAFDNAPRAADWRTLFRLRED
jgi:tRNA(His) 5'-end guanylyltransferase